MFTRVHAPLGALSPGAVTNIVMAASKRAGVDSAVNAHRLRHTAATEMLRAGAGLGEVGQVLRHRSQLTTAVYAKVDVDGTVALSASLPGTVGVRASAVSERGCWGEASPSHPIRLAPRFGIRRVPVPARGHPVRRALVPTLRIVLPGSGGAAR